MKILVKPNKRVANQLMAYVLTVVYMAIPLVIFFNILLPIIKNEKISPTNLGICGGVLLLSTIYILMCKFCFSWYRIYTIEERSDKLVVEQIGILDVMGNAKDVYTIKSITELYQRGTSCKIKGDITFKEPTRKLKNIKSLVLEDVTEEVVNLLKQKEESK